jgi:hemerythrin superfamily protein
MRIARVAKMARPLQRDACLDGRIRMIFESTLRKDAIDLLKQDHREVESLFREFESADDARKVELAETICAELTVHAQIEEKIFYPAAREALPEDKQDLVAEATVEHASLKKLIADIDGSSPRDELFEANVKVLSEYVKHHVREEETELMPAIRRTNIDLDALGERLTECKEALKASQQQPARRGSSNRVRVPMPAQKRASSSRKSAAAKSPRRKTSATARKSTSRGSSRGAATGSARSRTTATRKRTAARKQGGRKARSR